MPVIYLDVLIVLNWFIDYLLVSLTARLLRLPTRRFRLVLGALVGGVSACQIVLAVPAAVSLLLHILSAALIMLIAFRWHSAKGFLREILVFFCMSALLSGVVTALWYLTGSEAVLTRNGVIYFDISPLMLTAFSLISYSVIRVYERLTRRYAPEKAEYVLTVDTGQGVCDCRALYDTGLHLREPFSGSPVIVVCRRALSPFLSDLPQELPPRGANATVCAARRMRLIPYKTVSGEGLLPAFSPRRVTLRKLGQPPRDITGVYVALSETLDRGEYTALIGSDVIDL